MISGKRKDHCWQDRHDHKYDHALRCYPHSFLLRVLDRQESVIPAAYANWSCMAAASSTAATEPVTYLISFMVSSVFTFIGMVSILTIYNSAPTCPLTYSISALRLAVCLKWQSYNQTPWMEYLHSSFVLGSVSAAVWWSGSLQADYFFDFFCCFVIHIIPSTHNDLLISYAMFLFSSYHKHLIQTIQEGLFKL